MQNCIRAEALNYVVINHFLFRIDTQKDKDTDKGNSFLLVIMQGSLVLFLLWLCINYIVLFGECCESVPLDRSGSYVSISMKQYITRILALVVQVDAFYYQSLSWLHVRCNGSCFSSKLCISCVKFG